MNYTFAHAAPGEVKDVFMLYVKIGIGSQQRLAKVFFDFSLHRGLKETP